MTRPNRKWSSRHPRHRRRGFVATVTAVTLIALVSVVLAAIVAATVADVRRTRQLDTDAQFRQLLLAGAADAADHARSWADTPGPETWTLDLPETLNQRGYRVQISVVLPQPKANAVEVRVEAGTRISSKVQILRLIRAAGEWKLSGNAGGNDGSENRL